MSANDGPRYDAETGAYEADEPSDDDDADSPYTWPPWGAGWGWGWPSGYWWGTDQGSRRDVDGAEGRATDDDSWLDEGIFTLLIVAGVALFLFPEPGTSIVGVLLVLGGGIGWIVDALA